MQSRSGENDVRHLMRRAQALIGQGRFDDAQRLLRGGLERYPRSPEPRLALGIELMKDEPEESRRLLEEAAELSWDDPAMLFRVASALYHADSSGGAVRAAKRVSELADETFVLAADLLHLLSLLAREAGKEKVAERLLRRAFEMEPATPDHGRLLAGLLLDQDRFDEALDVVHAALEHRPGDPELLKARDWLVAELEP